MYPINVRELSEDIIGNPLTLVVASIDSLIGIIYEALVPDERHTHQPLQQSILKRIRCVNLSSSHQRLINISTRMVG
jgi:hypothetical protein